MICKKCLIEKSDENFSSFRRKSGTVGIRGSCKKCCAAQAKKWNESEDVKARAKANNKRWREKQAGSFDIFKRYGLTHLEYEDLLKSQDGKCAICSKTPSTKKNRKRLCVDHDHKTKKVRGLLCGLCNSTLGRYDDNPEILRKAIAYLERNPYMPVFEFLCPTHGRFEIMLSLSKYRDIYPCPVCEGQSEQVISRPNPPILRGHGFHANDYNAPTQR